MRPPLRTLASLLVALAAATLVAATSAPAAAQELERPAAARWQPTGTVHLVVQGGVTLSLLFEGENPDEPSFFAGGELAVGADIRLAPAAHLRALLVGGAQSHDEQRLTNARGEVVERVGTGTASGGVRLMLGLVVVPYVALRLGGELGFEALASVERSAAYGGGLFETALRLTDEERLEIVLQIAVQLRGRGHWVRTDPPREAETSHEATGRILLGVGWLF